jgi:hypothetical protein
MFGPEHYNARASELEAAAKDVTSTRIKADYLELARRYRELANLSSLSQVASQPAKLYAWPWERHDKAI